MNELGLFAGAGGGLLASRLLGWRTVCAVELDAHCQRVLAQRQRDGMLDPFPIWDDVRTFDGLPWRGLVDVISGGFPCQDISSAGRGAGIEGERSGLWREFARIIGEVRPSHVFVENSPMLASRGLGVVLGDLATLGFDARWDVLGARHVGAPHRRDRMWIVAAHPDVCRERAIAVDAQVGGSSAPRLDARGAAHTAGERPQGGLGTLGSWETPRRAAAVSGAGAGAWVSTDAYGCHLHVAAGRLAGTDRAEAPERGHAREGSRPWPELPDLAGVDDGVASRVERVRATGNGQVPRVAALAWRLLSVQLSEASS